jgi:adenine-specific DNA-methyltransferase
MEKLKLHSPDFTQENIARLAELFPSCVTESKSEEGVLKRAIDFDQLRQELSSYIVEGAQERYQLNWPGKREALLTANAPIAKTLRPCREESVDFDTTQNLFIEGDNLDALKLLQETYLNKVKLIYIDPPYNTGKDFIYEDDFAEDVEEYKRRSNEVDEQGNRLVANTESNGRFHSDWLSMMYSRLRLARNLLCDEGVIFISIDGSEVANLQKLCDEVFGEENAIGAIIWKNVTDNNPSNVATEHESIFVYARSKIDIEGVWKSKLSDVKEMLVRIGETFVEKHKNPEKLQSEYSNWFRENKMHLGPLDRYKYIDVGGIYTGSQSVHNPGKEGYRYDVLHPTTGKPCKEPLMGYRFPEATMRSLLSQGRILFGENHEKIIELKLYAKDFVEKLASVLELDGRLGSYDLRELFPEFKKAFTNPKPVELLSQFMSFVLGPNDLVLDFFAGSATTAHAVMKLNSADGGKRHHILVQLPELCDDKSEAFKAGYKSIAEISKERIRRAGKKIKADNAGKAGIDQLDIGFRVLKIDTSNMKDVYYSPDDIVQSDLLGQVENIREDRNAEDLLFQVLLDWGVDLASPISQECIGGKNVFFVDGDALAACFETGINEEFVKALAARQPQRAVFRDAGFGSDSVKINIEQIFKLISPATEVRAI